MRGFRADQDERDHTALMEDENVEGAQKSVAAQRVKDMARTARAVLHRLNRALPAYSTCTTQVCLQWRLH